MDNNNEFIGSGSYERFADLAQLRTNRALKTIQTIGNLSNKTNYQYKSQDVKKIIKILRAAISETEKKFDNQINGGEKKFSL